MSPESTHMLKGLYMEVLILGINTMYMLFCFCKLFPIGCIRLIFGTSPYNALITAAVQLNRSQQNQLSEKYGEQASRCWCSPLSSLCMYTYTGCGVRTHLLPDFHQFQVISHDILSDGLHLNDSSCRLSQLLPLWDNKGAWTVQVGCTMAHK